MLRKKTLIYGFLALMGMYLVQNISQDRGDFKGLEGSIPWAWTKTWQMGQVRLERARAIELGLCGPDEPLDPDDGFLYLMSPKVEEA